MTPVTFEVVWNGTADAQQRCPSLTSDLFCGSSLDVRHGQELARGEIAQIQTALGMSWRDHWNYRGNR